MAASTRTHALGILRKMLARCPSFQEFCGVGSWGNALARVHEESVAASSTRPFAVVRMNGTGHLPIAGGSQVWTVPWGTLTVILEEAVASTDLDTNEDVSDPGDVATSAHATADNIATELFDLTGTNGMLAHIRDIRIEDPALSDPDEGDPYVQTVMEVEYGLTG